MAIIYIPPALPRTGASALRSANAKLRINVGIAKFWSDNNQENPKKVVRVELLGGVVKTYSEIIFYLNYVY